VQQGRSHISQAACFLEFERFFQDNERDFIGGMRGLIFATVKKFKKNVENYIHFKKNIAVGLILLD